MYEENLPFARELSQDRLLNSPRIVRDDLGHDRTTIRRRGRERTDVAKPEHRHVQRAWNRCRRQREHICRHAKLEQSMFMFDAESLLFIDDHKTEIFEDHIL